MDKVFSFCNDLYYEMKNMSCGLDCGSRRHSLADRKVLPQPQLMFTNTHPFIFNATCILMNLITENVSDGNENLTQTYAWVSVSRKQMSKCNCRQAHTRPYTHTQVWIQVGTWGHAGTQSQILNICRNSV